MLKVSLKQKEKKREIKETSSKKVYLIAESIGLGRY